MDAPGKVTRRISLVCAGGHGGSRAASVPGQSDRRERDLELSQHRRSGPICARPPESRDRGRQTSGRGRCAEACAGPGARREEACAASSAGPQSAEAQGEDEEARTRQVEKVPKVARSRTTVPYVKISRDKRGYETYYLLEPSSDRSRQSRPRVLFW